MNSLVIKHVETILKSFDIEPKSLDRLLNFYLERHREISSAMRREIADTVFGIMRFKRRIEGALILRGVKRPTKRQIVERYLSSAPFADVGEKKLLGGAAAYHSFPDFLYEMFEKDFGKDGAADLAGSLNGPANMVLRVNTLVTDRGSVLERLHQERIKAGPGELSPFSIVLDVRTNLSQLGVWKEGAIDVQDESSQASVIAAAPRPGELILDACAGAGGKSLAMAMLMENRGRIIAADILRAKLKEIHRRAARMGVKIIETCETDKLQRKMSHLKGRFDLVYIDAPCSGTGTIRRNPDLKWRLTRDKIEENKKLELRLFEEYSSWARKGGRVVYATCSVLAAENEEIVQNHLKLGLKKAREYLRTDPSQCNCDGFFTAIYEKC